MIDPIPMIILSLCFIGSSLVVVMVAGCIGLREMAKGRGER